MLTLYLSSENKRSLYSDFKNIWLIFGSVFFEIRKIALETKIMILIDKFDA